MRELQQENKAEKIFFYIPMILYFLFIVILLILRSYPIYWITGNEYYYPVYPTRNINLVPFQTLSFYINEDRKSYLDVFGNIVLFIPVGIYYQMIFRNKKVLKSLALLVCTVLFIETSQYILATGSLDIDDFLMNTIGGIVGIFVCRAIYIICGRDNDKTRRIVAMASMLILPLLALLAVQYEIWLQPILYGGISICVAFGYDFLLFRFYKDEGSNTKNMFWTFAVIFVLMYLFLALPEVSPNII